MGCHDLFFTVLISGLSCAVSAGTPEKPHIKVSNNGEFITVVKVALYYFGAS